MAKYYDENKIRHEAWHIIQGSRDSGANFDILTRSLFYPIFKKWKVVITSLDHEGWEKTITSEDKNAITLQSDDEWRRKRGETIRTPRDVSGRFKIEVWAEGKSFPWHVNLLHLRGH